MVVNLPLALAIADGMFQREDSIRLPEPPQDRG